MRKIPFHLMASLIAVSVVAIASWPLRVSATPADEITQAVKSAGAPDVKQANPILFTNAVSCVLVGVDRGATTPYVEAAKKLRPDLSAQIDETAANVESATSDNAGNTGEKCRSRHRQKVTICCQGHTLMLPPKQAIQRIKQHPMQCHIGPCI